MIGYKLFNADGLPLWSNPWPAPHRRANEEEQVGWIHKAVNHTQAGYTFSPSPHLLEPKEGQRIRRISGTLIGDDRMNDIVVEDGNTEDNSAAASE